MKKKYIIFSGIQPSGIITLGNYLGAIKQWQKLQKINNYKCIYMIADLHCLHRPTTTLTNNIFNTLALLLACNINFTNNIIFLQSKLNTHYKLYWLLNSFSYFNELLRMTQFKNQLISKQYNKNIKISLLNYPILMAADILLYQTNYVPVGQDQKQHLELVKIIANRINTYYHKNIFSIPHPLICSKNGADKIMSLTDPKYKMSKSATNLNSFISLLDSIDNIKIKIMKAVTDSDGYIEFNQQSKPGISNLLVILANLLNKSINKVEQECKNIRYRELKIRLINLITKLLIKIQKKYYFFINNKQLLNQILYKGNIHAKQLSKYTLDKLINIIWN